MPTCLVSGACWYTKDNIYNLHCALAYEYNKILIELYNRKSVFIIYANKLSQISVIIFFPFKQTVWLPPPDSPTLERTCNCYTALRCYQWSPCITVLSSLLLLLNISATLRVASSPLPSHGCPLTASEKGDRRRMLRTHACGGVGGRRARLGLTSSKSVTIMLHLIYVDQNTN